MTLCRYRGRQIPIEFVNNPDLYHLQKDVFHIIWMKSGIVNCSLNGTNCYIHGESIFCLQRNTIFQIFQIDNFDGCVISFTPSFVNPRLDWNVIENTSYPALCRQHKFPDFHLFHPMPPIYCGVLPVTNSLSKRIEELFLAIEHQIRAQPDCRWSCRMRSHLFALQNLLDYAYHTLTDKPADPLMAQVCGYIASHLYEDITIDCLCRQYLINHTALTRRFRTYTGKSINVYINDKKLEMVKLQLAFTELTLKEIASLNGYATSPYLIRLFKAKTGLTPLVYRKRCQMERETLL